MVPYFYEWLSKSLHHDEDDTRILHAQYTCRDESINQSINTGLTRELPKLHANSKRLRLNTKATQKSPKALKSLDIRRIFTRGGVAPSNTNKRNAP